jgi:hypothetical protein
LVCCWASPAAGLTLERWLPPLARLVGGSELLPALPPSAEGTTVAGGLLVAVAAASLLPGVWAMRAMLVVAVLDLVIVLQPFRLSRSDPHPIAAALAGAHDYPRLAVADDGAALEANYGPVVHIARPSGYTSLYSDSYAQLFMGTSNAGVVINLHDPDPNLLWLLGYPAVLEPARERSGGLQPAAAEARADGFPLHSCVTIQSLDSPAPDAEPGAATLTAESAGHLDVSAEGPGWLVTDQPWYPGWSADVDGTRQPVTNLDGALVGVRLSSGAHLVRLRYAAPEGFGLASEPTGWYGTTAWQVSPALPRINLSRSVRLDTRL